MAEEAKPTTDAELATLREMCAKPETWAVGSATALGLVARIDTERTVRLAAEARVGVLTEALRAFIAAHDFAGAESWDCTGETRQRFEHAASAAKLLLEEPANG